MKTVTVDGKDGSLRLDRWFQAPLSGASAHGRLEKLLRIGRIRVDGKRARFRRPAIEPGQAIRIPAAGRGWHHPLDRRRLGRRPADEAMLQSAILHRDEAVIVLNKPFGGSPSRVGTGTDRHLDALLERLALWK